MVNKMYTYTPHISFPKVCTQIPYNHSHSTLSYTDKITKSIVRHIVQTHIKINFIFLSSIPCQITLAQKIHMENKTFKESS